MTTKTKQFKHGEKDFDRKYYKRFFSNYNQKEFQKYVNWFEGWFRFISCQHNLRNGKGKKALEIGCSLGYFAVILERQKYEVTATDISKFIIEKASKINPQIDFQTLDIQKNTLKTKYNYIFAFEVFEHLENPREAIMNCYKMLKKDGVLIFSTPFVTKQSLADPTHINVHAPDWWKSVCKESEFKKVEMVPATFVPFLYQIHPILSQGFKLKFEFPLVNTTAFYICQK